MNDTHNEVFDPIREREKLAMIAQVSDEPLLKISTVWPFQFFPSSIVVDRNKVDVIHGLFFYSKSAVSILIKDIRTVSLTTGLFFSSLRFDIKGFEENPQQINYLPKEESIKAHRLIIGLIAAKSQEISIEELSNKDIFDEAIRIGSQQVKIDSAM